LQASYLHSGEIIEFQNFTIAPINQWMQARSI
jgi:hypothetical protein